MQTRKSQTREIVRDRDTRSWPLRSLNNLGSEALVQVVLQELDAFTNSSEVEKLDSDLVPSGCLEAWSLYGSSPRYPGQALPASGIVQVDPSFGCGRAWVSAMWNESRDVMQTIRDSPARQGQYKALLSSLPTATIDFIGEHNLDTDKAKCIGLLNLVSFHRGEVVELSPTPKMERLVSCRGRPPNSRRGVSEMERAVPLPRAGAPSRGQSCADSGHGLERPAL